MSKGSTLGRNQRIAIIGAAIPYMMNFGLVCAGKLSGEAFWASTWPYVSGALAVILGASAAIKIGAALAAAKAKPRSLFKAKANV